MSKIDLTGKRFGRWTVEKEVDPPNKVARQWICKCDCGNTKVVFQCNLLKNTSVSCGCFRHEQLVKPRTKIDLTGKRFGRWTVEKYDKLLKGHNMWICKCDCGNISSITGDSLTHKKSLSCGCLQIESATTHGMRYIPEYKTWGRMKHRCFVKTHPDYKNYGGRGITVCDEWKNSFEQFYKDMGQKPFPKAQIDRINNNGNYEPGNCRWVTAKENINNRRTSLCNRLK